MQRRFFIPAVVAGSVHVLLFVGLMTAGRLAPHDDVRVLLPIAWIERPSAPDAGFAVPGLGPALPPPTAALPALPIPSIPTAPAEDGLSVLGGYIACGLNQALTAEERERCERQRREFYAGSGPAPGPTATDLALEKRFARDKAVQDAPILLPCFTPAGPNPFCLLGGALDGFEFETGSYADTAGRENPLAQPVLPYRPR